MLVGKNGEEGKEVSNDGREEGKEGREKEAVPLLNRETRKKSTVPQGERARIQQQESEVEREKAQKMSRKVKNSFRRWRRSEQHVSLAVCELQDHAPYALQIKQSREKLKRSVDASAKVLSFFRQERRRGLLKISYLFFFCPTITPRRSHLRCLAPCRCHFERKSSLYSVVRGVGIASRSDSFVKVDDERSCAVRPKDLAESSKARVKPR